MTERKQVAPGLPRGPSTESSHQLVSRLYIFNFISYIMHVYAVGSVHQGHEMFGEESRGRQCGFMALCSILFEQSNSVCSWSTTSIDAILVNGDDLYLSAVRNQLIPDAASVSLSNLLSVVRWCSNNFISSVKDTLLPAHQTAIND